MRLPPTGRTFATIALLCGAAASPGLPAQASRPVEPPPIEFYGFRPGASIGELTTRVAALGGGLTCRRSKKDPRVSECRASLQDPATRRPIDLWAAAIDSMTGVMTLSGGVTAQQLDTWRSSLERAYGAVGAEVQGSQWMMQWVRRGRMIRLTWQIKGVEKVASVSLVDGRVLDSWGRQRADSSP